MANIIIMVLAVMVVICVIYGIYQFTTPLLKPVTNTTSTQVHHIINQQHMNQRIHRLRRGMVLLLVLMTLGLGIVLYTGIPTLLSWDTNLFLATHSTINLTQCVHIIYISWLLWMFWQGQGLTT